MNSPNDAETPPTGTTSTTTTSLSFEAKKISIPIGESFALLERYLKWFLFLAAMKAAVLLVMAAGVVTIVLTVLLRSPE